MRVQGRRCTDDPGPPQSATIPVLRLHKFVLHAPGTPLWNPGTGEQLSSAALLQRPLALTLITSLPGLTRQSIALTNKAHFDGCAGQARACRAEGNDRRYYSHLLA